MLAEQLPNLRTVVIRETSVTGVGIEALSRGLRTLQLLDIGFNTISGGGELVVHPELETLYMGYMDDRLCDDWLLRQGWPFRAAQCPPLRQSFRQENNLQHIGVCVCVCAPVVAAARTTVMDCNTGVTPRGFSHVLGRCPALTRI